MGDSYKKTTKGNKSHVREKRMLQEGRADLQQKGHLKEYLYMEGKKELGQTKIRPERGSTEGRTMHTKPEK